MQFFRKPLRFPGISKAEDINGFRTDDYKFPNDVDQFWLTLKFIPLMFFFEKKGIIVKVKVKDICCHHHHYHHHYHHHTLTASNAF